MFLMNKVKHLLLFLLIYLVIMIELNRSCLDLDHAKRFKNIIHWGFRK